jgi:hypothetical protein
MDSNSTPTWTTLGAALLAAGVAGLLTLGTDSLRESWEEPTLVVSVAALVGGGLVFLFLLVRPLRQAAARPITHYKRRRANKMVRAARYRQTLQCHSCRHVFHETVAFRPEGWLPESGADRQCPKCGNTSEGFTAHESVALNKAARRVRLLA